MTGATAGKLFPLDAALMMPATRGNLFGGIMKFDPPQNARGWIIAFNAAD